MAEMYLSKMTYFISSGMQNLNWINQSCFTVIHSWTAVHNWRTSRSWTSTRTSSRTSLRTMPVCRRMRGMTPECWLKMWGKCYRMRSYHHTMSRYRPETSFKTSLLSTRLAVFMSPPMVMGNIKQRCDASACLCVSICSIPIAQQRCIFYRTLIGKPMLELEPAGRHDVRPPEVAERATKPSPSPLHKYLQCGCTINSPSSNCHQWGEISSSVIIFTCISTVWWWLCWAWVFEEFTKACNVSVPKPNLLRPKTWRVSCEIAHKILLLEELLGNCGRFYNPYFPCLSISSVKLLKVLTPTWENHPYDMIWHDARD